MKVEVIIDDDYLHSVLGDFAQHRSEILEVGQRQELKVIRKSQLSEIIVTSPLFCRL